MLLSSTFAGLLVLLLVLDLLKKIDLLHPVCLTLYLPVAMNLVVWGDWLFRRRPQGHTLLFAACGVGTVLFLFYIWVRLNVLPVRDGASVGPRLRAMIGGRFLLYAALWGMALEMLFLCTAYPRFQAAGVKAPTLIANGVYSGLFLLFLFLNGILRIFFTSRRLGVLHRVLMVCTLWIPLVNLVVLGIACRLVYEEYDYALYRESIRQTRVDNDQCRTRYPLVMVHGVLFRDLKYFNYWGRIPGELTRCGATVYYGNQEAVGTVDYNARDIKKTVRRVLEETGCEKVNIIAHSKGGLDARYAIGVLGLEDCVASLTTMGTPHRGCHFVDLACNMPDSVYRFIAKCFDSVFHRLWKEHPDFYNATRSFSTSASEEFNRQVYDSPNVYYQSYMTKMKGPLSDPMLALPYCIIRGLEGENDGLVGVESAKWGDFRGVLVSSGRRGISHGDIIDLKREDYRGFDVVEAYVKIVADLKQKGY